ncbi:unnamed protein product [Ilex paraguariensis]|uniref:ATG8-interacting protein 1 n=1 Tax=Ilex paraguariensis TaxID=185542 RepID=A0ABC8QSQ1_9AQUA
MADNEEREETTSRGNGWEVVSLSASTYAAAPDPGPKEVGLNEDETGDAVREDEAEAETSHAMFMSGHFVFPPSQHENLPLEPEQSEIYVEQGVEGPVSEIVAEEGGMSSTKTEENWNIKGMSMSDEFPGIQFFDEKGNKLSISGTNFEEGMTLTGLNLGDKEQGIYSNTTFSSYHSEASMGGSATVEENLGIAGPIESPDQGLDSDISQLPKRRDEDKYDGPDQPCEAWWKRRAASLYTRAKEANAFWSIFIAAAVMGLVIIGQHWQQERWQVLQLKWQFAVNDERMSKLLSPLSRLKDVIVGGHRRGSFIGSRTSTDH